MTVEAKSNPLLRMTGIPAFDLVTADHVGPAVDTILAETDSEFARIEKLASNSGTLSWWNGGCRRRFHHQNVYAFF